MGGLRHIALDRLKNDPTKLGIQDKRLKAGRDERYLAKLRSRICSRQANATHQMPRISAMVDAIALGHGLFGCSE